MRRRRRGNGALFLSRTDIRTITVWSACMYEACLNLLRNCSCKRNVLLQSSIFKTTYSGLPNTPYMPPNLLLNSIYSPMATYFTTLLPYLPKLIYL